MGSGADPDDQGSVEGRALDDLDVVVDGDAVLDEVAQHGRFGVRHARERPGGAWPQGAEADRVGFVENELERGNWVAVRVVRGVAELRGDARFEVLGDDMFQRLGFLVDAVPRTPRCSVR